METPDRIAVPRVQRKGCARADLHAAEPTGSTPPAGREVDEAGEHRRGARDPRRGAEAPARLPGARVERDERPVPGADEHGPPPDRGCRVDVRPDLVRPEQVAGRGAVGVDGPVRVPDEDAPVGNRRRGVEVLAPPEARERGRVPALPPGLGVDAVDAAVARRDVQRAARVGRRRHDLVVRRERPAKQRPALAPKPVRVEMPVPGAEVEILADDNRRRLDRTCPHAPVLLSVARVPGDDEPVRSARVLLAGQLVHVRLVDDAVSDGRRRCGATREVPRPDDFPGSRVDREEAALLLRDVDLAVGDRGRELDVGAHLQLPEAVVRRPQPAPAGGEVRALHVVAVRRPLLLVQAAGELFFFFLAFLGFACVVSVRSVSENSSVAEPRTSRGLCSCQAQAPSAVPKPSVSKLTERSGQRRIPIRLRRRP